MNTGRVGGCVRWAGVRIGAVRPPASQVVSLAETPTALADLAARRTTGKLVVRVADGAERS